MLEWIPPVVFLPSTFSHASHIQSPLSSTSAKNLTIKTEKMDKVKRIISLTPKDTSTPEFTSTKSRLKPKAADKTLFEKFLGELSTSQSASFMETEPMCTDPFDFSTSEPNECSKRDSGLGDSIVTDAENSLVTKDRVRNLFKDSKKAFKDD